MTLAFIIVLIGLCILAVRAEGSEAHRPGAHAAQLEAPKLHWLVYLRQDTNGILRDRCRPRPVRAIRPAQLVPEFARRYTIRIELLRRSASTLLSSLCRPTDPVGIIRYVFPAATEDAAVSVARCETGGTFNPRAKNPSSSASGLFQLLAIHWAGRFDPFDPYANTRYAYRLSSAGYDWSAWVCRP